MVVPPQEEAARRRGMDGGMRLLTPERVGLDLATAGIGSRGAALLIDSLCQAALAVLALAAVGIVFYVALRASGELENGAGSGVPVVVWILLGVVLVLLFLINFGYFILFEIMWNGQTPGKRALGLRVIRENGYPLRPVDAVVRNLARLVDALPAGYAIGLLSMLLSRRSKRVGDFAAGTIVVREAPARLTPLARTVTPVATVAPGISPTASVAPTAPITPATHDAHATPFAPDVPYHLPSLEAAHATLVRDFLLRRSGLAPPARAQLAHRLAATMAGRYGLQDLHARLGDEPFLERLPV